MLAKNQLQSSLVFISSLTCVLMTRCCNHRSQVTERAARAAAAQSFSCTFILRSTADSAAQPAATATAVEATVMRAGKLQPFPIAMPSNMPLSASEVLARLQDFAQQQQTFSFRLVDAQTAGESSDSSRSSSSTSIINTVPRRSTATAGSATDAEEMAVCDEARSSSSSSTNSAADCIDVSVTVVADQCTVHAALVPPAAAAAVPAAAALEAFVKLCDSMPGELLRQNRRWRRARMRTDSITTATGTSTGSTTSTTAAAAASDGAVAMELSGD
jgi:hypothetical protein